jgi:hypothetical protein
VTVPREGAGEVPPDPAGAAGQYHSHDQYSCSISSFKRGP